MSVSSNLPNFLYIGAAKCASTWIFRSLRAHPEIYVPPAKDLFFFDREFHRGMGWYKSFFAGAEPRHKRVGELSHFYLYSPEAALRIRDALPDVRLLACVRNPIRRAWSAYLFKKRNGLTSAPFDEALAEDPQMLQRGLYAPSIARYRELFGLERFRVCVYDDLERDAVGFGRELYAFLEVDPHFENPFGKSRVLPASRPRSSMAAAATRKTARWIRRLGFANFIGHLKASRLVSRILYVPLAEQARERLPPDDWNRLADFYAADVEYLSQSLGRDLSHWLKLPEH